MNFISKIKPFISTKGIAVIVASLIWGCDSGTGEEIVDREYTLAWEDNFDGDAGTAPDATKWTYDIGTGTDGWGNQELQYYTDSTRNVALDGEGNLTLVARSESFGGQSFTSGRIKTQGLFQQTYGRIEASIKTPYGPGLWPAFWMLGSDVDEVGWPQTGEIDIMELRGNIPNITNGTIHGPGYSGGEGIGTAFGLDNDRFDNDFHVFAVEWGVDYIDFFVDDRIYQRINPSELPGEWVYDHDFFIILNVAVGGTFVGFPTDGTPFPQTMYVDYVRVYTEVE